MQENILTREGWLMAAVEKLKPIFRGHGFEVPPLQASVGWPSSGGLATKKRTIGQCFFGSTTADGKCQIFISPLLDDPKDPMGVLATLVHEMVHTVAGAEAKHGGKFVKVMKKLGLEGKPTSTNAGGDLLARLVALAEELGPFPFSKITPMKQPKTQTTRMRKCECQGCGFLVRLTQKWLDVGLPICPVPGHGPMKSDLPKGDEEEGE